MIFITATTILGPLEVQEVCSTVPAFYWRPWSRSAEKRQLQSSKGGERSLQGKKSEARLSLLRPFHFLMNSWQTFFQPIAAPKLTDKYADPYSGFDGFQIMCKAEAFKHKDKRIPKNPWISALPKNHLSGGKTKSPSPSVLARTSPSAAIGGVGGGYIERQLISDRKAVVVRIDRLEFDRLAARFARLTFEAPSVDFQIHAPNRVVPIEIVCNPTHGVL